MPLRLLKYGLSAEYPVTGDIPATPELKSSYDVVIVGGGRHGLACAHYLSKYHGITNIAVLENGYLAGGNAARSTATIRSNYITKEGIAFYKEGAQLYEEMSKDLDFNVMFSQRCQLKLVYTGATLQSQGYKMPGVNEITDDLLRFGNEEAVVLNAPADLCAKWEAAAAPNGYYSRREETWAMMHLTDPRLFDLMARICPVDLSSGEFAPGQIALTRVGYVEAITWRNDRDDVGFDVLFDIAATDFLVNAVAIGSAEFNSEVSA